MYIQLYYRNKQTYNNINGQYGGKKMKNKQKHRNRHKNNKHQIMFHVSEPWFSLISTGLKTVEGRKNKGKFKDMKVGDVIVWTNDDFGERYYKTKVVRKTEYKTFYDYLQAEGLDKCLPSIPTIEQGLSVYFKYYTKEDEARYGVVAIELEHL